MQSVLRYGYAAAVSLSAAFCYNSAHNVALQNVYNPTQVSPKLGISTCSTSTKEAEGRWLCFQQQAPIASNCDHLYVLLLEMTPLWGPHRRMTKSVDKACRTQAVVWLGLALLALTGPIAQAQLSKPVSSDDDGSDNKFLSRKADLDLADHSAV